VKYKIIKAARAATSLAKTVFLYVQFIQHGLGFKDPEYLLKFSIPCLLSTARRWMIEHLFQQIFVIEERDTRVGME
jgi:hypothetical protein